MKDFLCGATGYLALFNYWWTSNINYFMETNLCLYRLWKGEGSWVEWSTSCLLDRVSARVAGFEPSGVAVSGWITKEQQTTTVKLLVDPTTISWTNVSTTVTSTLQQWLLLVYYSDFYLSTRVTSTCLLQLLTQVNYSYYV